MRHIFTLAIFSMLSLTVFSQKSDLLNSSFVHENSVQAELFGHGLLYSLNYERVILNGQKFKTTAQIGLDYYPPSSGNIGIWMPVVVNELFSFNKHHMELGAGYVFTDEAAREFNDRAINRLWSGFYVARLGYRYQKPDGRMIFRIGFTPFLEGLSGNYFFHPSGGLAIGYSF